jgi:hypothetical protein
MKTLFSLQGKGALVTLEVLIRQLLNKCVKFLKEHGYLFSGMKKWIRVGQLMARVKAGGKALGELSLHLSLLSLRLGWPPAWSIGNG